MGDDPTQPPDAEDSELDDLLDEALRTGFHSHGNSAGNVIERLGDSLVEFARVQLRAADNGDRGTAIAGDALCGLDARYDVRREIGQGGVGRVYRAHDTELGRDVAIKVLHQEHMRSPGHLSRFVEEAQIGGQLNHPSILPVHELGLWGERIPFFAMKLVSGETFAALLGERASPGDDHRRFLAIFEQVCQAVAYAHSRGVVHRDLKPANVMVGRFGEVQVMDWGMAKVLDREEAAREGPELPIATARSRSDTRKSAAGSVMGTLAYLAPEQARGKVNEIDERTDVFGLGAMLCEVLTGKPPYVGVTATAIRRAARAGDLGDALTRLQRCGADAELVELACRCLRVDRSERPHKANVVAEALADYLASAEERAREAHVAAAVAGEKASTAKRVQRLTLIVTGSLLLTLLFAIGFLWIRSEQNQRRAGLDAEIRSALSETRRLQGQAQVAADGDLAGWTTAKASLKPAQVLAQNADVDDELRSSVEELGRELTAGLERAEALATVKAKDQAMVRRLEEVAAQIEEGRASFLCDEVARLRSAGYQKAFADYGLAIWNGPLASVADAVANTKIVKELVVALDDWAVQERVIHGATNDRGRRLQRIALEVDRDPWRQNVRRLLLEDVPDQRVLVELANEARPEDLLDGGLLLARALWRGRKHSIPEAIRLLERAFQANPSSFVLAVELGFAHSYVGPRPDWKAVRRAFSAALTLRPDSVGVLLHLGQAMMFLDDLDASADFYSQARDLHPEHVAVHHRIGVLQLKQGKVDDAIASFREAIRLGEQQSTAGSREDLKDCYRYNASCSAALAAGGKARDGEGLSDERKAALRMQAVTWLHQDLEAWCRFAASDEKSRLVAIDQLRHAQADTDLVVIRDAASLRTLPEAERAVCSALWDDYRRAIEELEKDR